MLETKKIGDILELQRGYDLPHSQMQNGSIPVVGSNGIIGYHNEEKGNTPCITVGRSGSVGKVHLYNEPAWAHNTALYVKDFKGNNPLYIYYLLKNLHLDARFGKVGSVIPSLDRKVVHALDVMFHDNLEEQKKIVAILSIIDRKIKLNKQINCDLEVMAKQLYDYWFVQFDFPNEEGKPYKSSGGKMVWNKTLKREIPEGWDVMRISDIICHINTGLNPRNNFILGGGNIRYITVKNLTVDGKIDFSSCDFIDDNALEKVHNRSKIRKGDILFASISPLGRCFFIDQDPDKWDINESVFSIRPKEGAISGRYLYLFLKSEDFVKKAEKTATGSIFSGIRMDALKSIEILMPSKHTMEKFDKIIGKTISKQHYNFNEIEKLIKLRDELLPLLMNGQVTIKQ